MTEPASIRTKNPGAMWPGPTATRWGSKRYITLKDGNKIAVFENWIDGISAQLDLWMNAVDYKTKPLSEALFVWSGNHETESYINYMINQVPGITRDTILNEQFWHSPNAIKFLKAQARHEAGQEIPVSDLAWTAAVKRVLEPKPKGVVMSSEPSWLRNARELVGLKEIVGSRHEAKVVAFFAEAGHPEIHDDETPWCAAFANAMMRRSGYATTGSLAARSFLTYGEALQTPIPGCIAVFKRGNSSWEGHVAFFLRDLGSSVEVLGGNQSNSVSIMTMPKSALLGYRWPAIKAGTTPTPAVVVVQSKPPVKKPSDKGTVAVGTGATVIVGGAGAAAAKAGLSAPEILAIVTIVSLGVMAIIVLGYRIVKRKWPWSSTGEVSLEQSLPSHPPSVESLEQVQAHLDQSSVDSPETPLPPHSALSQHLKQLVKQSPKTPKRRKNSARLKASAAKKSLAKPKSKSKSSKSKLPKNELKLLT